MRKSHWFFFVSAFFIFTSLQIKGINVSDKAINDNMFFIGMGNPDQLQYTDTIAKDSIHRKKHRLIAAVLAFPVIGIFGFHRMYLGTSTKVPVVYIVTAGGVFGVLPFIDFVLILLSKDIHKTYTHNRNIFMWQRDEK